MPNGTEDRKENRPQDQTENSQGKESTDSAKHNRRHGNVALGANGKWANGVIGKSHQDQTPEGKESDPEIGAVEGDNCGKRRPDATRADHRHECRQRRQRSAKDRRGESSPAAK